MQKLDAYNDFLEDRLIKIITYRIDEENVDELEGGMMKEISTNQKVDG